MTVKEFSQKQKLNFLVESDPLREIKGGYCGDLLSWVMSRMNADDCWFTVMGNINTIAVAVLADCACIVLCENASLDDDARIRAKEQNINVLTTESKAFSLAVKLGSLL